MPMIRTGKTHGKYAQQFPDYCYQKRIDVHALDFLVDCRDVDKDNMPGAVVITLFFVANDFTVAKENKRALQIMTNDSAKRYGDHIDDMLHEVFQYPKVTHYQDNA